jgi:uncharacterized protein YacL
MRQQRPAALVEFLRLAVVVFGAAAGYELGKGVSPDTRVLGPLGGIGAGVVLGTAVGYVLGGVIGRSTLSAVETSTHRLRDVSAESMFAGGLGAVTGALVAAAVAWPVFFLPDALLAFPLFSFVVLAMGILGSRLAAARKHSVVAMVGGRGGLGARPVPVAARERLLDASVAADGRLLDVVRAGFLAGPLLLPGIVLADLEADAAGHDVVRAARARRALEVLDRLRREPDVDIEVLDTPGNDASAVLLRLGVERGSALLTANSALVKAARLAGVAVQDMNALAAALRPPITAGDEVDVLLVRAGKDAGQAVGFLDDGTMVVAESARACIGKEVTVGVVSVLLAEKGRIVFGQLVP